MSENEVNIKPVLDDYIKNISNELKIRWNKWPKDLMENNVYEVIGGILSRQSSLAIQLALNMNIWNEEIAPIILRTMADTHINLAWILINPKEHSEKFILHGLGQLKLELEHRKNNIPKNNPEMEELLQQEEEIINSYRYTFLTEVNLGSWSGLNTRKMAEDSGLIDFYNYVYQPFSNCTHSTWAHIAKYNLKVSENPLHRFLKQPSIIEFKPHISYMDTGAKYLEKSFKAFDKKFELETEIVSSYEKFIEDFNNTVEKK
ncbi:DUF5677 domain-containing protein [Cellulophaga baltica]|uniref:DUF5677 domain-containing protein n=1 Tax=Cellulophaga baltica TaxID=76594 RepID=UPI0015F54DAC|nr:DUF5677 domain-containing protein [Cellulophaga baltica]MBA6316224.1 hypothetical protein [Cellulophaga baltica]